MRRALLVALAAAVCVNLTDAACQDKWKASKCTKKINKLFMPNGAGKCPTDQCRKKAKKCKKAAKKCRLTCGSCAATTSAPSSSSPPPPVSVNADGGSTVSAVEFEVVLATDASSLDVEAFRSASSVRKFSPLASRPWPHSHARGRIATAAASYPCSPSPLPFPIFRQQIAATLGVALVRVQVVVLDSGLRRKLAAKMTLKVTVAGETPKASKLELAVETAATSQGVRCEKSKCVDQNAIQTVYQTLYPSPPFHQQQMQTHRFNSHTY